MNEFTRRQVEDATFHARCEKCGMPLMPHMDTRGLTLDPVCPKCEPAKFDAMLKSLEDATIARSKRRREL